MTEEQKLDSRDAYGVLLEGDFKLHEKLVKSTPQFDVFEYEDLIVMGSGVYLSTKYCRLNPPELFRDWLIKNYTIINKPKKKITAHEFLISKGVKTLKEKHSVYLIEQWLNEYIKTE